MSVYDNVKTLCDSRGISLQRLEKECGFGGSTISKWSKSSPSVDKLLLVAKYFNVSIDSLVGFVSAIPHSLSADEQLLIDYYRSAPDPARRSAISMLEEFSRKDSAESLSSAG